MQKKPNLMKCGVSSFPRPIRGGCGSHWITRLVKYWHIHLVSARMRFSGLFRSYWSHFQSRCFRRMTGAAILEICRRTPILSARKTRKRLNVKISLCEPTSKGCVVKLLCRKTICFSKSVEMHDIVIGLVINIWEFGFVYIQNNNFRA